MVKITDAKHIYTIDDAGIRRFEKDAHRAVCYYHSNREGGKEIRPGDVVFSAKKTRKRTFRILAHLACALRMGVITPEDLEKHSISSS
jgi:hypothetical protein